MTYEVVINGNTHRVELTKGEKTWVCKVDDSMMEVDAAFTAVPGWGALRGSCSSGLQGSTGRPFPEWCR